MVKSAYHLAFSLVNEDDTVTSPAWKILWKLKIPPKAINFYWRLCKGWLAVRAKLVRRGVGNTATCPVCNQEPETIWHLLVRCSFAKQCWSTVNQLQKIEDMIDNVESSTDLFLGLLNCSSEIEIERIVMVAWQIWNHRNEVVWKETSFSPVIAVHRAITFLEEWKAVRVKRVHYGINSNCQCWHKPKEGEVKINVDASFCKDSFQTGLGMIIRDDTGMFVAGRTLWKPGLMTVDEGEA